jgi:hypothetical protein
MTANTSRRTLIPYHVRDHAEPARDAAMKIQAKAQAILDIAADTADAPNGDPWKALAAATSNVGTINRLAALIIRELESINGIDRPIDVSGLQLVERNDDVVVDVK